MLGAQNTNFQAFKYDLTWQSVPRDAKIKSAFGLRVTVFVLHKIFVAVRLVLITRLIPTELLTNHDKSNDFSK